MRGRKGDLLSMSASSHYPSLIVEEFYLTDPRDFRYMNQSGCIDIEGTDDAMELQENMVNLITFILIRLFF